MGKASRRRTEGRLFNSGYDKAAAMKPGDPDPLTNDERRVLYHALAWHRLSCVRCRRKRTSHLMYPG